VAKPIAKPVVAKPAAKPVVAKPAIAPVPTKVAPAPVVKPVVKPAPAPEVKIVVPVIPQRMAVEDLQFFEALLLEKRATLVSELDSIEDANLSRSQTDQGGELSGYTNHLADAASDYTTLETNLELAEREGKYLINIEDALERIRKGTYGVCKVCHCLIPKKRLEVVPTATKCVNCKQETKKREAVEQQQELVKMYAKEAARK
jgi:DnaK suppressor protein